MLGHVKKQHEGQITVQVQVIHGNNYNHIFFLLNKIF